MSGMMLLFLMSVSSKALVGLGVSGRRHGLLIIVWA